MNPTPHLPSALTELAERLAQRLLELVRQRATRARLGKNRLEPNVFWVEI